MAFANASNFTMENPQFNAITNQTNVNQLLASDRSDPMQMLLYHSAINAMVDSPSAPYAPTCHPGTKEAVTGDIMAWARDPMAARMLWLSGPAGGGKSCIQRKIVQLLTDEGFHVSCFFFSIRESETSNESRFITTLAAQLAEHIPGLKWYIEKAIKMDHRIFTRSLESQVEGLIFKPLQALEDWAPNRLKGLFKRAFMSYQDDPSTWTRANVVVIDGLDECVDEKEQAHILHLICVLANHSQFPFRFVIASRPEFAIRTTFSSSSLSTLTRIVRLEAYEADEDIRQFLKVEFNRLKSEHPASKSIPADWPSTEDEDELVAKASGQFVYVSVVMKHLTNRRLLNPMFELQRILGHQPSESDARPNPFAELDALFNRILQRRPNVDISFLKPILHAIIHDTHKYFSSLANIDTLFDLAPNTTALTLVDLHSVVDVEPLRGSVRLHHKSLEDFLTSHSRAGDLYESSDMTHKRLTLAYHQLGLRHPTRDTYDWEYVNFVICHAVSVTNWSLFEAEFAMHAIPSFIEEWFIRTSACGSLRGMNSKKSFCEALFHYSCQYHFVHCGYEDGCLGVCKRLKHIAKYSMESDKEQGWSSVLLTDDPTIMRNLIIGQLDEAADDDSPPPTMDYIPYSIRCQYYEPRRPRVPETLDLLDAGVRLPNHDFEKQLPGNLTTIGDETKLSCSRCDGRADLWYQEYKFGFGRKACVVRTSNST